MKNKRRVLLIDDDESILSALGEALEAEGYEVVPARDGEDAMSRFRTSRCDIALLDLNMPVKCGWDTFQELTSADPLLPIIVITARPDQRLIAAAAGVGALMEKPLDFPLLFRTMNDLIKEPKQHRLARLVGSGPVTRFPEKPVRRTRQVPCRKRAR